MATDYKILGQAQGVNAPAQENINLYPDPNHERYTSEFNPGANATNAVGNANNSIWVWDPASHNTSHAEQHWPMNNSTHGGAQASGRTGYVRFSSHENTGNSHSQGVGHARSWFLDPDRTGTLTAGKTYTINLWAHATVDSHNHHAQHGQNSLQFWDGAAWQIVVGGFAGSVASHLNNVDNTHAGINQIQTDAAGDRQSWASGWCRYYRTFTAQATDKFRIHSYSYTTFYDKSRRMGCITISISNNKKVYRRMANCLPGSRSCRCKCSMLYINNYKYWIYCKYI